MQVHLFPVATLLKVIVAVVLLVALGSAADSPPTNLCTNPSWTPVKIGTDRPLEFRNGEWYIGINDPMLNPPNPNPNNPNPYRRAPQHQWIRYCQVMRRDPTSNPGAVMEAERRLEAVEKARIRAFESLEEQRKKMRVGVRGDFVDRMQGRDREYPVPRDPRDGPRGPLSPEEMRARWMKEEL
ncbi:hypothetical protein HDU76_007436 [Blyttiomyces sp. JEL0837]|nr:hypothetical protein HDU76_007436 [Blyttiomyces sp. JEL0837]